MPLEFAAGPRCCGCRARQHERMRRTHGLPYAWRSTNSKPLILDYRLSTWIKISVSLSTWWFNHLTHFRGKINSSLIPLFTVKRNKLESWAWAWKARLSTLRLLSHTFHVLLLISSCYAWMGILWMCSAAFNEKRDEKRDGSFWGNYVMFWRWIPDAKNASYPYWRRHQIQ